MSRPSKLVALAVLGVIAALAIPAEADHTPAPSSVTIAGSLQDELGCPGDWQPDCAATYLVHDAGDDVWQREFPVPAGNWEYKAALNDSWDEAYGDGAILGGPNILLALGASTNVKFYYDHKSHWITDNVNSVIGTVVGSFQSELGCPGDWQPDCLLSWLQDADGDGIYEFATDQIPVGDYEFKVTLDEAWDTTYPAVNAPFTVATDGDLVTFRYDSITNDVIVEAPPPPNGAPVVSAGSNQTITLPASAALDGTVTDDGLPSGSLSLTWTKQSGPGVVTFGDAHAVDTTAGFSTDGVYVLRLTATDGALTESDDVTITTRPLPDFFVDDADSVFEADINWMAGMGITKGCNPPANDRFCPEGFVTRGQMAAFLVRALNLTDRLDDPFVDDDDSIFEADIERLAAAGITRGCNPPANDRFCPDGKVTRGQMAAFLVRALDYSDNGGGDLFVDDDDSVFEGDIDRLGTAGVTRGCNPPTNDRFCPSGNVTRGQMAAFLHRALG